MQADSPSALIKGGGTGLTSGGSNKKQVWGRRDPAARAAPPHTHLVSPSLAPKSPQITPNLRRRHLSPLLKAMGRAHPSVGQGWGNHTAMGGTGPPGATRDPPVR